MATISATFNHPNVDPVERALARVTVVGTTASAEFVLQLGIKRLLYRFKVGTKSCEQFACTT
jgi:hypothetical protein